MPAVTFDQFGGGLDLRRSEVMTAANVLLVLRNAYISTGKSVKKRPCLTRIATLEAGTKGLRAGLGKLNTFYAGGSSITHANTLFQANRVYHSTDTSLTVTKCHYAQPFNGYLYCALEYSNGDIKHAWLDDDGTWVAATAYPAGTFRRPTVANGFRYEVTSISGTGTSGGAEPVWPTTPGLTVTDNPGANQIVWTCRALTIADANCPNTKIVRKIGQKIYAAGTGNNAGNVNFCAAAAPRDWTTSNDAGFLPSGINAAGSDTVTALGDVGGDLGVFFDDSMQVWTVKSDPSENALKSAADSIGTKHYRTPQALASDLVFLAQQGFRSVSLVALTDNLQENDVGSSIEAIRNEIADTDEPITVFYPRLGQLWTIRGSRAYVYAFARSVKLSAWQIYDFPVTIDDATVLAGELYVRSGDVVYKVDADATNDDGDVPEINISMFYQDGKQPGVLKQFWGFDGVMTGSAEIAFRMQAPDGSGAMQNVMTDYYDMQGDMRPGLIHPMEICAVAVAPVIRHQLDEVFELHSMMLYYESLGPMG